MYFFVIRVFLFCVFREHLWSVGTFKNDGAFENAGTFKNDGTSLNDPCERVLMWVAVCSHLRPFDF